MVHSFTTGNIPHTLIVIPQSRLGLQKCELECSRDTNQYILLNIYAWVEEVIKTGQSLLIHSMEVDNTTPQRRSFGKVRSFSSYSGIYNENTGQVHTGSGPLVHTYIYGKVMNKICGGLGELPEHIG